MVLRRLFSLALAALPVLAIAQPSLPGGGGGVTPVPLDGGLGLLALAGGAYAVRKLRQRAD